MRILLLLLMATPLQTVLANSLNIEEVPCKKIAEDLGAANPSRLSAMKIETARTVLRPLLESDAAELGSIIDEKVIEYYESVIPEDYIRRGKNFALAGVGANLGIFLKETGKLAGSLSFISTDLTPFHSREIDILGRLYPPTVVGLGYFIGKPYRKDKLATEVVLKFQNFAIEDLRTLGIIALVRMDNTGSIKVLKRTGFLEDHDAFPRKPNRLHFIYSPQIFE